MHGAVKDFIAEMVEEFGPFKDVLEIGSRNVNGTIRQLFGAANLYLGIDNAPGPGVDIVVDAAEMSFVEEFDCVVCCEVLEHTPKWREIIARSAKALRPGGVLLVTCAGPERDPHAARDEEPISADEYYGNIDPEELSKQIRKHFLMVRVTTARDRMDVQACAESPA